MVRYPCGIRLQDTTGYLAYPDAYFLPSEPETNVNTAAQAGWPNQVPSARTGVVASRSCPVGKAQATQPSGRISNASTSTRPCGR